MGILKKIKDIIVFLFRLSPALRFAAGERGWNDASRRVSNRVTGVFVQNNAISQSVENGTACRNAEGDKDE